MPYPVEYSGMAENPNRLRLNKNHGHVGQIGRAVAYSSLVWVLENANFTLTLSYRIGKAMAENLFTEMATTPRS
jgi:hypothetical protein